MKCLKVIAPSLTFICLYTLPTIAMAGGCEEGDYVCRLGKGLALFSVIFSPLIIAGVVFAINKGFKPLDKFLSDRLTAKRN